MEKIGHSIRALIFRVGVEAECLGTEFRRASQPHFRARDFILEEKFVRRICRVVFVVSGSSAGELDVDHCLVSSSRIF